MARSSRFTVAVHVLTLLASEEGRALTSDYIAGSVNTNPVVIRRVLSVLSSAGLVRTTEGVGGGTVLARAAGEITLAEVYRAVEQGDMFAFPPSDPNPLCPVGRRVQAVLEKYLDEFQTVLEQAMARVTIAQMLTGVQAAGRK